MLIDEREGACEGCRRPLAAGVAYQFHGLEGPRLRCGTCALFYRPLLRRSLGISLVVGSVLLAINQGDILLAGHWSPALAWKIPLTYLVPFVVATWGALLNSRVR
ncbi:MAG: nitrate/nitrite transporter NrtS [Candidatus Rokuibacteriota bacterium]